MQVGEHNVLVVDDDERLLAMYRRSFDRAWTVHAASTPDEAARIAREHRLHAAIVDLHLGTCSSISLVRELRTVSAELRIAVVSGYLTTETTVIAVQAGANIVVDKPIRLREVMRRLELGPPADIDPQETPTLDEAIESHIARVYSDCGGNVSETARRLGIYRSSLQRRLRKHALKRPS